MFQPLVFLVIAVCAYHLAPMYGHWCFDPKFGHGIHFWVSIQFCARLLRFVTVETFGFPIKRVQRRLSNGQRWHLFLNKRFISSWLENFKGKNKFWDVFCLVSMQWLNFDAQTQIIVEAEFGILRTIKSKQKHSKRCFSLIKLRNHISIDVS